MKKRILFLSTVLLLACIILSACKGDAVTVTSTDVTTAASPTTPTAQTSAPITTAAPITTTNQKIEITLPKVESEAPDLSLVDFDIETDSVLRYSNSIRSSHGDPFVMRYDGSYYLYYSVGGNTPIYVHKSDDLVNWTEKMICVPTDEIPAGTNEGGGVDEICLGAYAPEVVYCNGLFVMVTSPGGMGHYIFTSDSPLGPFKRASENFGCKIDGDIFIDNDGKWYFYYANSQGILCRPMLSPTEVDTSSYPIVTGSIIDEGAGTWTEGSMIVYHDGIYYMTYTGNHVRHTAYRIEYGISYDGPTKFKHDPKSQVFVSTTAAAAGIGHSSSVKGPDLDSYYIVYHTRSLNGKSRDLNIDRIIFNGEEMIVLGPTIASAAQPSMPDIYSLFEKEEDAALFEGSFTIEDGRLVLGSDATVYAKDDLERAEYTIELSVSSVESGAMAGAIFGYKDDNNYGSALFDTATEELVITFVVEGEKTEYREKLVRSFDIPYDFNAVQAIQVEKSGNVFTFYVNDRLLCKHESTLSGTGTGVTAKGGSASFGFFGATAAAGGNSNKDFYKPVATQTGYVLATHCREWDITTGVREDTKGLYLVAKKGDTFNYSVQPERSGKYSLALTYSSKEGAVVSVFAGGKYVGDMILDKSDGTATSVKRNISLAASSQVITLYIREGNADLYYFVSQMSSDSEKDLLVTFEDKFDRDFKYSDSTFWTLKNGELKMSSFGKRLYGSYMYDDYIVSVDARVSSTEYKYGILVRCVNPGESTFITGANNVTTSTTNEGAKNGQNWFRGYYVEFEKNKITVYKNDYDKNLNNCIVYTINYTFDSRNNNLAVAAVGDTLYIYVNYELVGEYKDPEPYTNGMAGLRCRHAAAVYFDNFKLEMVK